jgi:hypothetical protein
MRWFAVALLALSAACGSDGTSAPTTPTLVGTWKLESINGSRLPYVLDQAGSDKLELLEAGLTASASGKFTATSTERTTIAGTVRSQSYVEDGSFTMAGAIATLTFASDGVVVNGTVGGDSLTFGTGNSRVIYLRQ